MKRLILLASLVVTPALAEQPQPPTPTEQSWHIMYSREVEAHQHDLATAVDLNTKLQAATAEKAALQAKLDAEKKAPETAKAPTQ